MDMIIVADDLSLGYGKNETIISKASFSIDSGSFVFITGASGSGKSTLLKSFFGALPLLSGNLTVGGVDMAHISSKKLNFLRRHVGIVFQDYKLVKEWSIEKNVMLPLLINGYARDVSDLQVEKLLGHVKLSHQRGKYPMELSGGEQQRVAMARALAHNPILILADEPTGNLDDYSSKVIWNLLEGANTQLEATVVVVTHHIPESFGTRYRHYHIEHGDVYEVS
ncbi:MAG: ABC transporter ATP-binding protein [Campylobacterales bacterium]